jgi:hypothetical protein
VCGCWDRDGGGRAGEAGRCCGAIARGFAAKGLVIGGWDMCGGNVGLGGLGAVGTGADAGTGGGIGAGAFVAGLEV